MEPLSGAGMPDAHLSLTPKNFLSEQRTFRTLPALGATYQATETYDSLYQTTCDSYTYPHQTSARRIVGGI
jgi:hypothetical protein